MASALAKIFGDTSRVRTTVTVKRADGTTVAAKLTIGASGLDDASIVEAARHGVGFTMSLKSTNAEGETIQKRNAVKAEDVKPTEGMNAVAEILGTPAADVPDKLKSRSKPVAPSENGNHKYGAAAS